MDSKQNIVTGCAIKVCRFLDKSGQPRPGLVREDGRVVDLSTCGLGALTELLEQEDARAFLSGLRTEDLPGLAQEDMTLLAPLESQEVWAAGVTYQRSKTARMEESDFSATAYDRVYEAARPELFFKALAHKVAGPGTPVGIRRDSRWNVPEPELALVINSRGRIAGCTVGNDLSSREIEGENLLYLPQAKIYRQSCALGPVIRIGVSEPEVRQWHISLGIERTGRTVYNAQTSIGNIRRSFGELVEYLFRSQDFPQGVVLLTGTGIVPPKEFTLEAGDRVTITIEGIGVLENSVVEV